jgi:hypothetical protein
MVLAVLLGGTIGSLLSAIVLTLCMLRARRLRHEAERLSVSYWEGSTVAAKNISETVPKIVAHQLKARMGKP